MSEREFKVEPYGVDYICDDCGNGKMEPNGTMLMCDPPKWQHYCEACGAMQNLANKYPEIRYRRVAQ